LLLGLPSDCPLGRRSEQDILHYSVWCLLNAGATYQRALQACLSKQIGENVEAYVDGVVVKTKDPSTLIVDLQQTFGSLRKYKWKLNPIKCMFGVPSGQLLGFLVSHRDIEASTK
jgi:hypothetical protein